jgi:enamine deaminase RidA (YjgF/YER057c/UK114 family)
MFQFVQASYKHFLNHHRPLQKNCAQALHVFLPWQEGTSLRTPNSKLKSVTLALSSQDHGSSCQEQLGAYHPAQILLPSVAVQLTSSSFDYATGAISPSITGQAEQTLQNIQAALHEAGASMQDVVRVRYILPDAKEFPLIWPVLKKYFSDVRPAATMIQAELMEKVMKIEIEVTARKSKESARL